MKGAKGIRRCDAQGKTGKLCGKPAAWRIDSAYGHELHYCDAHKKTRRLYEHFSPMPGAKWDLIDRGLVFGEPAWITRSNRELRAKAKPKRVPTAYRVIWWRFIHLGGLGWEERKSFSSRGEAREYVREHSAGLSPRDARRFKIEPVYL
jgi:hypothetical protein